MTEHNVEWLKGINMDRIRAYIGWLLKTRSVKKIKYDKVENMVDYESVEKYNGEEISMNKDNILITKTYLRKQTGILANMIIKALTNIELYKMDKIIKERNKGIKLNTVRTDSIGYSYDKEIDYPMELIREGLGYWKIENKKQKVVGYYKLMKKIEEPIHKKIEIKQKDDIIELLENNESFIICGDAGCGKTHNINSVIIPKLNNLGKKSIVLSLTTKNSDRIEGKTFASLVNGKSTYELLNELKGYNYMIIDEAQLLSQDYCKYMEYLKENTDMKYILIGDENQTKGNVMKKSWELTNFLINMCDGNKIEMKENIRCDDELMNLIEEFKKQPLFKMRKYVEDNFKITKNIDDAKYHLCRHSKTKEELIKKGYECYTIITEQGNTINQKYMIHDLKFLPKDQILTALSRGRNKNEILIYC